MNTKNQNNRLYDVFTGEVIEWDNGNMLSTFESLGLDYTNFSKMHKGIQYHIKNRYTIEKYLHRVFILVEVDTGKEYNCISNCSLFIQLGLPYNDNEGKYIYELKSGRQARASIGGKVFSLKGGKKRKTRNMKAKSDVINNELEKIYRVRYQRARIVTRIMSALRSKNVKKNKKINEMLGCSYSFLYSYIESKFTSGMGWHNRNLWHIDHIRPVSDYNLENEKDIKYCFHYTNLQPIWKTSEIAKMMGEPEWYDGNLNKNNKTNKSFDYTMALEVSKRFPYIDAVDLARELYKKNIRKVDV